MLPKLREVSKTVKTKILNKRFKTTTNREGVVVENERIKIFSKEKALSGLSAKLSIVYDSEYA